MYTLKIYIARAGEAFSDGGASIMGYLFYVIGDGSSRTSYGFYLSGV